MERSDSFWKLFNYKSFGTKYYEDLADIPTSIYFDSYGYTGFIATDTQKLDSDRKEIEVVFKGIVFRNGPATGAE